MPILPICVYATEGSKELARGICTHLQKHLPPAFQEEGGVQLQGHTMHHFKNDNRMAVCNKVRGRFVVVAHAQSVPVDTGLMELFLLLDAICESSPDDVLVVFPYMPYARSDKKNRPRISVFARRLAKIINGAYDIRRVLLLDPHGEHVPGFFNPMAEVVTAVPLIVNHLQRLGFGAGSSSSNDDAILTYGDAGETKRHKLYAHALGLRSAYIDKDRPNHDDRPEALGVVGHVRRRRCLLVDDEVASGATVKSAEESLLAAGALSVPLMAAIHAVLEPHPDALDKLRSTSIPQFVFTDSVPVKHKLRQLNGPNIQILSVAGLLGEAIAKIAMRGSLEELDDPENVPSYTPSPQHI